jgi:hypothetical protein
MLKEHDRSGFGYRPRAVPGQEVIAGGDEGGDLGARVALAGAGDIWVHGTHLAGERGPDNGGTGVWLYPEPSGGVHDLVIMARPGHRAAVSVGLTAIAGFA